MRKQCQLLFALVVLVPCSTSLAHGQQICTGILSYASRDEVDDSRDTATAQSLYKEHCEGSTSRSASQTNVGLEAVVKAIPVSFSLGTGSSKEKLNNFCKIASEENLMHEVVNIRRSTVVREALDAFNRCVAAANKDVYFDPIIGKTSIVVSVRRGVENVNITGVRFPEADLACSIATAAETVEASLNSRVAVASGGAVPITCERIGQQQSDGSLGFPATELTILTDRENLLIPVAADATMPVQWATDISERIADLEQQVSLNQQAVLSQLQNLNLDCRSTTTESGFVRNPDGVIAPPIMVQVPEEYRSTHVVVGGSCELAGWEGGRGASGGGGKSGDGFGWQCRAGDPPNVPLNVNVKASVTYCDVASSP